MSAEFGNEDVYVWVHFLWILVYMLATLYTFAWDVFMDWKLGQLNAGGLRARRMTAPERGHPEEAGREQTWLGLRCRAGALPGDRGV